MNMIYITNHNFLLYRLFNKEFIACFPEAKTFIKHQADYLAEYFVKYVGLDRIGELKRSVNEDFKKSPQGNDDLEIKEFLDSLEKKRLLSLDIDKHLKYAEDSFTKIFSKGYRKLEILHCSELNVSEGMKGGGGVDPFDEVRKWEVENVYPEVDRYEHYVANIVGLLVYGDYTVRKYNLDFNDHLIKEHGIDLREYDLYALFYNKKMNERSHIMKRKIFNSLFPYSNDSMQMLISKSRNITHMEHNKKVLNTIYNYMQQLKTGGNCVLHMSYFELKLIIHLSHIFEKITIYHLQTERTPAITIILKNKLIEPPYNFNLTITPTHKQKKISDDFKTFFFEIIKHLRDIYKTAWELSEFSLENEMMYKVIKNKLNNMISFGQSTL